MEWINRVGLMFEFLSFWFAAPEILGEKRLRKLLELGLKVLPAAEWGFLAVLGMGSWGLVVVLKMGFLEWMSPVGCIALWIGAIAAFAFVLAGRLEGKQRPLSSTLIIATVVGLIVALGLAVVTRVNLLASVASTVVMGLVLALAVAAGWALQCKVVWPLMRRLVADERFRQRSLALGAVLFVIGFLLQIVATF